MTDTMVTLHGWVGGEVVLRQPNGVDVATFRVASTPRVRRNDEWVDGETTWYTVSAWRTLATHVRDSVHRGDAVIVHGRLRTHTWERESGQADGLSLEVDAILVGHDLTRGTSAFLKKQHGALVTAQEPESWEQEASDAPEPVPVEAAEPVPV
ncbi:MAG: single-stranded DNA-binding protein [Nocardioidaceae bacterium]